MCKGGDCLPPMSVVYSRRNEFASKEQLTFMNSPKRDFDTLARKATLSNLFAS